MNCFHGMFLLPDLKAHCALSPRMSFQCEAWLFSSATLWAHRCGVVVSPCCWTGEDSEGGTRRATEHRSNLGVPVGQVVYW